MHAKQVAAEQGSVDTHSLSIYMRHTPYCFVSPEARKKQLEDLSKQGFSLVASSSDIQAGGKTEAVVVVGDSTKDTTTVPVPEEKKNETAVTENKVTHVWPKLFPQMKTYPLFP